MNRASNGNLGSRSRKRGWTDSVIPSRWVARQQPPRRLGSRRASIRARDSPELPGTGIQHRNRAVTGPDRRLFLLTHDRSTAPRWRPSCGVAVIGTSARCPGTSSWTRGRCRQRAFACPRLRGRQTASWQFTSESVRWWNRCDPANCRHRRSNGSSGATTVWSRGAG